ncbi:MAG: hypothetical protein M3217_00590 [Actinomycetota bacterium]|nr:hypothetical protein [Actinomycetota bacterium]
MAEITRGDAIREYPELELLADLRAAGWLFRPLTDPQSPEGVVGVWPRPGYTDILFIYDQDQVEGVRVLTNTPDGKGKIIWSQTGPLAVTVNALLGLPEPPHAG